MTASRSQQISAGLYEGRADYRAFRLIVVSGCTTGSSNIEFEREATIISQEGKIRVSDTAVMILPRRCRNWRLLCMPENLMHIEGKFISQ